MTNVDFNQTANQRPYFSQLEMYENIPKPDMEILRKSFMHRRSSKELETILTRIDNNGLKIKSRY